MEKIISKNNERIKAAAKLVSSSANRRERGLFIIEGVRLCRDAFLSGAVFEEIFVTEAALKKYSEELTFLYEKEAKCFEVSEDAAAKLSGTVSPQGIFCVCKTLDKKYNIDKIGQGGRYIAFDNLQNPDNLGACLRTAEALGINGVIVGGGCDIYNPKVQRAAMGAALRLPVFETDDLPGFLRGCALRGLKAYSCTPNENAVSVTEADFSGGAVCVIGNEGAGISGEVMDACGGRVTIPMKGRAESLNAASAAAIVMWEMVR